ncbi:RNA-directed DNA polymerase, eukaryota, reverse transcriptase zinc-binding domain protein [Tanacetum coccineum]
MNLLEKKCASFFWDCTQDSRKLAWVKWPIVLASLDKRGLGIGSFKSFNLALLQKWRWRFSFNPKALWVKVGKAFHGQESNFGLNDKISNGIWSKIIGSSNYLHLNDILPSDSIWFRVGCGTSIRFWKDLWTSNAPLYLRYNRLFRLEQDKDCLISDCFNNNHWAWNSITRHHIDTHLFPSLDNPTQWDKTFPRKVNIYMWHFMLDRLPQRLKQSSPRIDISMISYPSCNGIVESSTYIFFECVIAKDIWNLVRNLCDIPFPPFTSYRNSVTFCQHPIRRSDIYDNIRSSTFSWLDHRGRMSCSWVDWLKSPMLVSSTGSC